MAAGRRHNPNHNTHEHPHLVSITHPNKETNMTILDVREIPAEEIQQLGDALAQAVEEDRDELAQHRSLRAVGEAAVFFDVTT